VGFNQYNGPANELPPETRTFARIIVSLGEEAEAINWYEQRNIRRSSAILLSRTRLFLTERAKQ
jgi:hypothetical protein